MLDLSVQTLNQVAIEGILQEVALTDATMDKNGKSVEYVRGDITFLVQQKVGKELESSLIPVNVFVTKLKNNGDPNPAYLNIQRMRDEAVSIAAGATAEAASRYRLTSGQLSENAFATTGTTRIVQSWRIRNSFFNKVTVDFSPSATFTLKIIVLAIKNEEHNDAPTGRLIVSGGLVQYGERLDVLNFVVEDPVAIKHISNKWSEGATVNVQGRIRVLPVSVQSVATAEEETFGEDIPVTTTRTVRELVITGGSATPLDPDNSYDVENAVPAGLSARRVRHDAELAKAASRPQAQTATSTPKAKANNNFLDF